MNDDPIFNKSVFCLIHKTEKVTHICNQLQCHNNPLLCSQCFSDSMHTHYHSNHQNNIEPFIESVDKLSNFIKTHIGPMKKVFKTTLGKSEFAGILEHVEKGTTMFDELEERINVIKNQVQLELDLLMKEFQKTLLVQKQEYFKILDNYQRAFVKNLEFLRSQTQPLIEYQQSLKYYGNKNNMYLKAISETRKKSDWLIKSKKTIMSASKIIQNTYYSNDIVGLLSNANKIRFDLLPTWKGQQNIDKGSQLRYLIKRALNQWVYVPEIKNLNDENQNGRNYLPHNPYK